MNEELRWADGRDKQWIGLKLCFLWKKGDRGLLNFCIALLYLLYYFLLSGQSLRGKAFWDQKNAVQCNSQTHWVFKTIFSFFLSFFFLSLLFFSTPIMLVAFPHSLQSPRSLARWPVAPAVLAGGSSPFSELWPAHSPCYLGCVREDWQTASVVQQQIIKQIISVSRSLEPCCPVVLCVAN